MQIYGGLSDHALMNTRFIVSELMDSVPVPDSPDRSDFANRVSSFRTVVLEKAAQCFPREVDSVEKYHAALQGFIDDIRGMLRPFFGSYYIYLDQCILDRLENALREVNEEQLFGGDCGLYQRLSNIIEMITNRFVDEIGEGKINGTDLEFIVSPSRESKLHELDICKSVIGKTKFKDSAERNLRSDVRIEIKSEEFIFGDFQYIPYIVAHEIICHGFQACLRTKPRQNVGACCEFTEGFVDAAALERIKQWLDRELVEPNGFLSERDLSMCAEFKAAAETFNRKRRNSEDGEAFFRRSGWRLFEGLAKGLAGKKAIAPNRDLAAAIALCLNASSSQDDHDLLIRALELISEEPDSPHAARLMGAARGDLRDWRSTIIPSEPSFLGAARELFRG